MKSSIVGQDFDLLLELHGQKWLQGDLIRGSLEIINKTQKTISPKVFDLSFVYADIKKFKNLSESSYREFIKINLNEQTIAPTQKMKIPWELKLDLNAPVECKKYAPYILWGDLDKKPPASLMVKISPCESIEKIIEIWRNFFRFSLKDYLSVNDDWIEYRFNSPLAKEYAKLDTLVVKFKREENKLLIFAKSTLKLIAADTSGMKIDKKENTLNAEWKEKEYLLMPNFLNQEYVCAQVKAILEKLMNKN